MSRKLWSLAALATIALIGAACGSNAPSETGTASNSGTASSRTTTSRSAAAVKFAQCMRDNGVAKFPDPDSSGELTIDGVVNGSSLDPDGAAFKHAIGACKDLQPAGFTGRKRSAKEQDAGLRFAQCIRDHGVKDFPDPAKGEPLVNTYKIPSSNEPGGMARLRAAMAKCDASEAIGAQR